MAFGSFNGQEDSDMSDINVTPLVDVMLVLMIVFMISMPVFTSSIQVNLPTSSQVEPLDKKNIVRVTVNDAGQYFIDDQPVPTEDLGHALQTVKAKMGDVILAIHADKAAQYEAVATLLNQARLEGLVKVGFITQPETITKAP